MLKKGVIVSSLTNKLIDINEKIDFVLLRAGFTDYNRNKTKKIDVNFYENYKFAKENNMKIGVFYESCATNMIEAKEEIDYFINIIGNKNFEYPICIKVEDDHNTILYYPKSQKNIDKNTLCNIVHYMYNRLEDYGHVPAIITFKSWYDNIFKNLDINFLLDNNYIYINKKDFYNKNVNVEIVVKKNTIFSKTYGYIKAGYKLLIRKTRKK